MKSGIKEIKTLLKELFEDEKKGVERYKAAIIFTRKSGINSYDKDWLIEEFAKIIDDKSDHKEMLNALLEML